MPNRENCRQAADALREALRGALSSHFDPAPALEAGKTMETSGEKDAGGILDGSGAAFLFAPPGAKPPFVALTMNLPTAALMAERILNPDARAVPADFTGLHQSALLEFLGRVGDAAGQTLASRSGLHGLISKPRFLRAEAALREIPRGAWTVQGLKIVFPDMEQSGVLRVLAIPGADAQAGDAGAALPRNKTLPGPVAQAKGKAAAAPRKQGEAHIKTAVPAKEAPANKRGGWTPALPIRKENLESIEHVPLMMTALLGEAALSIEEALNLSEGSIVPLNRKADEPIDVCVNGRKIAEALVVAVGDRFALKIARVIEPR